MLGRRTYGVGRVWPSSAVIPALLGFALSFLIPPLSPAAPLLDEGFDGFQTGVRPAGWTFVNCNANSDACTAAGYFGDASPSLSLSNSDDQAVSCAFALAGSENLTFWARGAYTNCSARLLVEEFFASSWHEVTSFEDWPEEALLVGPYPLNSSTTQIRISNDVTAYLGFVIDDVRIGWKTPTPTPTPLSPTPTPLPSLTPVPTASPVPSPTPRTASYLVFSTFLGGFFDDRGVAVDLASSGEIFAAGWTIANDFPTCNPYQASLHYNYDTDAFVAKFASCGSILLYSTYLGGWEVDVANDIRVDSIGRAWVTGVTASSTFPTRYPFQAVKASGQDAFFCRLGATGSYLVNSSFLGGRSDDLGYSLALTSSGNIFLAGETASSDFPTRDAAQASLAGGKDLFVSSFASHTALVFSTFWGGGGADTCAPHTLLAGTGGGWSVAGTTSSTDFPLAGAYQSSLAGGADAFVSVFASATAVAFSSYLGGSANDTALGLASDTAGAIYLAGGTLSGDFPTLNAYQAGRISAAGFLAKFPPEGGALLYSTYFGNYAAAVYAVNVDTAAFPYLVGITRSGFPIKNAYQGYFSDTDKTAFAAKLSSDGSQVCYSTYLGGPKNGALDAALSSSGTLVVTGYTDGLWPLLNAYQSTIGDYDSACLAGLRYAPTPTATPPTPTPTLSPTRSPTPTPTPPTPVPTPSRTPSPPTPSPTPSAFPTPSPGTASYLHYSTYLGGTADDTVHGIDLGPGESIFVAGLSQSIDFPIQNAYQCSRGGDWDAFVCRFASSGSRLVFSTYIGGASYDVCNDLKVDSAGRTLLTGYTYSSDFPIRDAYQPSQSTDYDAFFSQLDETGAVLTFSSYLGGYGWDAGYGIDHNPSGGFCLFGKTLAVNFPTRNAYQPGNAGGWDAFVCSFSSPTELSFSTYLGGAAAEDVMPGSIFCGSEGNIYIAGSTLSSNFPTLDPYQASRAGSDDAFLCALSPAAGLLFCTYLGGAGQDIARGIAVEAGGDIYLVGETASYNFPTLIAYQSSYVGYGKAAFLTKLSSKGSGLSYSTFLGSQSEAAHAVAVDSLGSAYIAGETAAGIPVKNAYQCAWAGNRDAFAAKFSPDGSQICFSTYFGGSGGDYAYALALAPSGTVHMAGYTYSADFPVLNAYQDILSGGNDGWLAGLGYAPTPSAGPGTPTPVPTAIPPETPTPVPTATASPAYASSPTPPPPELLLSATPVSGTAPLTVSFAAAVTGGAGIQYYRWDYNADGVWDYVSAYASRSAHTYSKAGTYQAICEVEDSLGRVARDSVFDILVSPAGTMLSVDAYADPDAGLAPLSTTLSGDVTASNPVLFYLWDFEHDGIVDSVSLTTPTAAHIYGEEGAFAARLTVIDSAGLMASDTAYIQVIPSFPPPVVTAEASPLSGAIPLPVDFSGAADPAAEIILYEWDFEGDGAYDWSSPTGASCSHTYTVVGTYEASLRATKTNGMRGQDAVTISALAPASLQTWISTPQAGWTVRGNAVTVRANTAPGYLTQWVQPQFKAETAASWTDLTVPIRPPPYSFSCSWDTTLVPDGAYRIRARAADVSDGIAYSDTVSVTVDNSASDPELDEARDVSGNHAKRQKAASDRTSLLEIAGGTFLQVPCGALASETAVILSTLAANPHPADGVLFAFTAAALETGALGKPALLVIPYPDADGDGVVDGTGIDERSLAILRYNSTADAWQETPECTVSAEENLVQAGIMAAGDYALGATCLRADRPVLGSGDYDGDGTSEIAVFRPAGGVWAVRGLSRFAFGSSADVPAPGDYDGDGTSDPALFRPASGLWAVRLISRFYFGAAADLPVAADYDGDGREEAAVFRRTTSLWAVRAVTRAFFGSAGDQCSPGDFDGDGTEEAAVFRPRGGLWAVRNVSRCYFGSPEDEAVAGDYSGGGKWAAGIFRYSSGLWAIRGVTRFYLGEVSDFPLPADYDGNSRDEAGIFRSTTGLWSARGLTRAFFGSSGDLPATR